MMQVETEQDRINIAIDGPAGAGKSTVARKVAARLGYIYIDTGAMYRAVTLSALQSGIEPGDLERLTELAGDLKIELSPGEHGQTVWLNGSDVTDAIRSREVTLRVSEVAAVEAVRTLLVDMQRQLAIRKGIVMDGRDIGTHVLPDAELKIFLTASVQVRAARRYEETKHSHQVSVEQLEKEIAQRDKMDQERKVSPLLRARDAILVDSTNLSIEQVVSQIVELSRTKMAEAK
ncbi:(d)CMP kinase [Paenibacillus abyssi]|uniref:Cytidylate kinase n=1 Tax=Paenibacillus abyssi TaxID=1340531 RepID=A0A917CIN9_9BACL|nr:(d)CMP kinase [Paenibacillus abyssi]GGF87745.1 cytidylate kinase [Paenibacillus abyssi]